MSWNLHVARGVALGVRARRTGPARPLRPRRSRRGGGPSIRSRSAGRKPRSPSRAKGTSGMSVKLTSWLASVAAAAMKPASRPMSLTRPMPLRAPLAPRRGRKSSTSLGLGPRRSRSRTTARRTGCRCRSSWGCRRRRSAARGVRPPRRSDAPRAACRRRRRRTGCRSAAAARKSTITAGSWLPREEPRIVPPSGGCPRPIPRSSCDGRQAGLRVEPLVAVADAQHVRARRSSCAVRGTPSG